MSERTNRDDPGGRRTRPDRPAGAAASPGTAMRACDVIDLAILGILSEGPIPAPTVVRAVKQVGLPRLMPTSEVVEGRIGRLLAEGRVAVAEVEGELVLTEHGCGAIADLLRAAGPSPAEALGAVCQTLRICLLDRVAPEVRQEIVADMIHAHRRERDRARRALTRCPCRCRFVERCLARDVERWDAEIGWLETIAEDAALGRTWW